MMFIRICLVDFRELRGMGIQMSKLVVDNVKGKQTGHRTLLNFVARSRPAESVDKVPEEPPAALPAPAEMEERSMSPANPPLFELPSASQIDPAVFDQLPDDVKKDIMQDYKRKGINLPQTTARTTMEPVAGPSSRPDDPVSYERINEVSDIDSSYWSALPDDIKAEIEKDIKQRKAEATSPSKKWNEIFRPRPSPTKAPSNKGIKRKAKAAPEVSNVEKILKIQPIVNLPQPAAKVSSLLLYISKEFFFISVFVSRRNPKRNFHFAGLLLCRKSASFLRNGSRPAVLRRLRIATLFPISWPV